MKKLWIFSLVAVMMVSVPTSAFSKEFKVGYVDIFKIFNEYQKTIDYDKVLEQKKKKQTIKLEKKKQEIEKMQGTLSLLEGEGQETHRAKITQAAKNYRELERKALIDLRKERDERMKEIIEDINAIVDNYAKKNGFDLVINENAILYGQTAMDITTQILKLVNKQYKR